jgi:hypothetical protein
LGYPGGQGNINSLCDVPTALIQVIFILQGFGFQNIFIFFIFYFFCFDVKKSQTFLDAIGKYYVSSAFINQITFFDIIILKIKILSIVTCQSLKKKLICF